MADGSGAVATPARALVTGAAVRVGRAIALELAAAGFDVAVHYNGSSDAAARLADRLRELGAQAYPVAADLAVPGDIQRMFAELAAEWGTLDLLVNSAAIFPRSRPEDVTPEDWDRVIAINARAPFLCAQAAAELMGEAGGSIVNIADVAAYEAWPSYVPYAASKAAVVSLTLGLARAWAPRVRVNAVAPGPVMLPDGTDSRARRLAASRTALGRVGDAKDVAEAVLYLASAEYVTGEVIRVDGGAHLLKARGSDQPQ